MKILLFGSDGQLGSEISSSLKKNSHELIESTISDVDFKNQIDLSNYLNQFSQLDLVINCVALTNTTYCEEHPAEAFAVNAYPLETISRYCKQNNITLVHFSTDYVFDGNKNSPYEETDPVNPVNEYGKSKLEGEQIIQAHHDKYYIIRISSLYGRSVALGKNTNLMQTIITKAKLGGEHKFVQDQLITPTYTQEIVQFIDKLTTDMILNYGIYHLTCQGHCSYYELANYLIGLLKYENVAITPVNMSEFPAKIKRPKNGALSSNKISPFYKPSHWKKALENYIRTAKIL